MAKAARLRRAIRFSRVPKGIAHAGAWKIDRQLRNGTIVDILDIDGNNWRNGKTRVEAVAWLAAQPKPRRKAIKLVAGQLVVSQRTIERWLRLPSVLEAVDIPITSTNEKVMDSRRPCHFPSRLQFSAC